MFVLKLNKSNVPQPAVGRHAEILAELTQGAERLLQLLEAERRGTFDNLGADFWIQSDPILQTSKKLAALAQERISVL